MNVHVQRYKHSMVFYDICCALRLDASVRSVARWSCSFIYNLWTFNFKRLQFFIVLTENLERFCPRGKRSQKHNLRKVSCMKLFVSNDVLSHTKLDSNILVENDFFLKNYITSEGAFSHDAVYLSTALHCLLPSKFVCLKSFWVITNSVQPSISQRVRTSPILRTIPMRYTNCMDSPK